MCSFGHRTLQSMMQSLRNWARHWGLKLELYRMARQVSLSSHDKGTTPLDRYCRKSHGMIAAVQYGWHERSIFWPWKKKNLAMTLHVLPRCASRKHGLPRIFVSSDWLSGLLFSLSLSVWLSSKKGNLSRRLLAQADLVTSLFRELKDSADLFLLPPVDGRFKAYPGWSD